MKKKRKVGLVLLLLVVLLLLCCVCKERGGVRVNSWENVSKPSAMVEISAELLSKKRVDVETPFEVKVGIGNPGIYSAGTLGIYAPGFVITDEAGAICNDAYTRLYENFKNEMYGYKREDGKLLGLKYTETFQFRYVGNGGDGKISFRISTLQDGEEASEEELKYGKASEDVCFFYSVKNGKITLTTERTLEEGSPLLTEEE